MPTFYCNNLTSQSKKKKCWDFPNSNFQLIISYNIATEKYGTPDGSVKGFIIFHVFLTLLLFRKKT